MNKVDAVMEMYVLIILIILILYNKSTHKSTPYRKYFLGIRENYTSRVGNGQSPKPYPGGQKLGGSRADYGREIHYSP